MSRIAIRRNSTTTYVDVYVMHHHPQVSSTIRPSFSNNSQYCSASSGPSPPSEAKTANNAFLTALGMLVDDLHSREDRSIGRKEGHQ